MTEQQTLSLAAFLLARIDEDEDKARRTRWGAMDRPWVLGLPSKVRAVNGEFPPDHLRVSGRRVLAECEAKRKIVETLTPATVNGFSMFAATVLEQRILRLLAQSYADHPDYRADEWRP